MKAHALVRAEINGLIKEVDQGAYADHAKGTMIALRWRSCPETAGRSCRWCPRGHGPYWFYYYWVNNKRGVVRPRSVRIAKITHRELLSVVGHTRGYHVLKAYDERLQPLRKRMALIREAVRKIDAALRVAENALGKSGFDLDSLEG
ncbi:MAG: hypothetical protein D6771_09305 [Zetaproteobacteria bacterium]|nr:MAG: hypothetical protein D6771_09305 [Zetaproteobacteria bacterium]